MTPDQFCYWLQGFFELSTTRALTKAQAKMIQEHLSLVMTKVTPEMPSGNKPAKNPVALDELTKLIQTTSRCSGHSPTKYC